MDKKIAMIASVKEREEQLRIVVSDLYDQVDEIHLVLNWYTEFPEWIGALNKINPHLNPENKNAHDSIWAYVEAENLATQIDKQENYFFTCDDDLLYPADYIEKLIETIEKHKRRAVVTVHGAIVKPPIENYFKSRHVYHFVTGLEQDLLVDMAGCGTVAFHSSTIKPTLLDFPIIFMRDLWFSILCAKNKVPIIAMQRPEFWIGLLQTNGDTVFDATNNSEKLTQIKNRVMAEELVPLIFCKKKVE